MARGLRFSSWESFKMNVVKNFAASNAFDSVGDALGTGIDALFANNGADDEGEVLLNLDDIEIVAQVREELEDEENSLLELGMSMKIHRQLQPIIVRPIENGPRPYRLVAGERRYRGAQLVGLTQLRAKVRELTDEEAEDIQLAENIQRKNLTQIEEAKKIQRDLDRFGSVEAVLEKHQKSRAWLSKILALLSLPEQAKRLVSEQVSADLEIINTVKTIEKTDPKAAKELVDDLKKTRGKSNAREKVAAVKERVKPSKNQKKISNGIAEIFASAKKGDEANVSETDGEGLDAEGDTYWPALALIKILDVAYINIFEHSENPRTIIDALLKSDRKGIETWLRLFYDAGIKAKNLGCAVIQGFRNGVFSSNGAGAFALSAFLYGAESEAKFSVLNIIGSVKK
jgi:ParB family transcriptional regulator, chromosome partitioning protein